MNAQIIIPYHVYASKMCNLIIIFLIKKIHILVHILCNDWHLPEIHATDIFF